MALTPEQQALDFDPELQGLSRERKLAELLMAKGAQGQPQGQMISGYYVAPSWSQQLNPMANMLAGEAVSDRADVQQTKLAEALRTQKGQALSTFQQLMANPETRGQAMQYAASNRFLQPLVSDMMKPQKLGEGENLVMPSLGGGEPINLAAGGIKVDPDTRRAMQFLGINKPLNQLTPQELQAVENKAIAFKKAGANNISLNLPSEGERKGGFMANILDRNLLQMQTALGVDPSAVKPNVPASIVEAIAGPNLLSRSITPAQRQIIEDSQLDVLDAALTLRTGAAYTREQLKGMRDTYFPKLGDKPPAIAAKNQRLETLLEGAYIVSGRATPQRVSAPSASTAPAKPNVNQQLNIPAAPVAPKFLGFEDANR